MESTAFLVVGCGPAGASAAREAAEAGVETIVLEKDAVVGAKRVCAAGLRPGFCETFGLPRSLIHFDTPRMALFDARHGCHAFRVGPAHTTTREELDGAMASLAVAAGADLRVQALYRTVQRDPRGTIVEYADLRTGARKKIRAKNVFFATGATARFEPGSGFAFPAWQAGLITCYQRRVYLCGRAAPVAYESLELHYYVGAAGRQVVGWMFPKRDHLAIGLGVMGKMPGARLREELDLFTERVRARLYPGVPYSLREEGHLLYGGPPRPQVAWGGMMVGGTAAGLVDATNGEGIYEAAMTGRLAADAVQKRAHGAQRIASAYAHSVRHMFYGRLRSRERLMRFLERNPRRFEMLFEQIAGTPRFAEILQREGSALPLSDRMYLYGQALRFGARTLLRERAA